jgi:phage terminase small subunit
MAYRNRASGLPARGYSWPPFEPRNQLARTHGVWAADVAEEALTVVRWLYQPDDVERHPAMALMGAEVWVRWRRALADVRKRGLVLADGSPNPLLPVIDRCERKLLDLSARFGLDPRSEAELARGRADAQHSAFDMEALVAKGRAVIEAQAAIE